MTFVKKIPTNLLMIFFAIGILFLDLANAASENQPVPDNKLSAVESEFYSLKATNIDGELIDFSKYKNQVVLIANTASGCGFTPQFKDLQALYEQNKDRGFVVLGFPSGDFFQEKSENSEIKKFCQFNYKVNFPMFTRGHVKGAEIQPVFQFLVKNSASKAAVKWNFEKFLLNRKGQVIGRWSSATKPSDEEIVQLINKNLQ